ncbi:hypothetical protein ILUMI_15729, partial [Ignelater luminosus]
TDKKKTVKGSENPHIKKEYIFSKEAKRQKDHQYKKREVQQLLSRKDYQKIEPSKHSDNNMKELILIERMNNNMIKGFQEMKEEIKKKEEKWEKEKADLEKKIENLEAKIVIGNKERRQAIVIELDNWEDKIKIMAQKNKLRSTTVYIENDLTMKKRKIQYKILQTATTEKNKGSQARIAYKELIVGNEEYEWIDDLLQAPRENAKSKN